MRPNPKETADLVTFTEEILNGKLHFLCSGYDLSSSSCYPTPIEMQIVLYFTLSSNYQSLKKLFDYGKRFTICRYEFRSLENCFDTFCVPTVLYNTSLLNRCNLFVDGKFNYLKICSNCIHSKKCNP